MSLDGVEESKFYLSKYHEKKLQIVVSINSCK